jgi:hypothetical protein
MKKMFLIMLVALLSATAVNAQFTKGGKTLSGRLSGFDFEYDFADYDKMLAVNLSIAGSYFVADNLAITAEVGLFSSKYETKYAQQTYTDNSTNFTFGAGVRYYFSGGLYGGLAYTGILNNYGDYGSILHLEVGYDYYITDNVFFEPAIYYEPSLYGSNSRSAVGLSIGVGVKF